MQGFYSGCLGLWLQHGRVRVGGGGGGGGVDWVRFRCFLVLVGFSHTGIGLGFLSVASYQIKFQTTQPDWILHRKFVHDATQTTVTRLS